MDMGDAQARCRCDTCRYRYDTCRCRCGKCRCRQPGHCSSLDAKHLKLTASFCHVFVSPSIPLLKDVYCFSAPFPVRQQQLFQRNPVLDPQIQSPCHLKSLQFRFDAELHLGYVLLIDIPLLEMHRWLIFQRQHSYKANPKAAVTSGIFLDWCN